jgi:hypothetical protein
MTPKEKAEKLINAFIPQVRWKMGQEDVIRRAKQCALIAVDEIIAQIEPSVSMDVISARIKYWQEVKQEIEKL